MTDATINGAAALAPEPYSELRTVRLQHRESGEQLEISIEVSAPYKVSDDGLWACALRLKGLDDGAFVPHGRALFGVDGWQALSHAMRIAQAALIAASAAYDLSWFDGTPMDPEEHL